MVMLPPLSQRLRPILKKLAADESHLTAKFASSGIPKFATPLILTGTTNLIEKTLISLMEEIEKGPGSTRLW